MHKNECKISSYDKEIIQDYFYFVNILKSCNIWLKSDWTNRNAENGHFLNTKELKGPQISLNAKEGGKKERNEWGGKGKEKVASQLLIFKNSTNFIQRHKGKKHTIKL